MSGPAPAPVCGERRDLSRAMQNLIRIVVADYPETIMAADLERRGLAGGTPYSRVWGERFLQMRRILRSDDDDKVPGDWMTVVRRTVEELSTWPQWRNETDGINEQDVRIMNAMQRVLMEVMLMRSSPEPVVIAEETEAVPNIAWEEILSPDFEV